MRASTIAGFFYSSTLAEKNRQGVTLTLTICLGLTLASKSLLIGVPVLLKLILDSFQTHPGDWTPFILVAAYAFARFGSELLQEAKNWLFVPIMANCARALTLAAHDHLFRLPLSFHLTRKSGALIRTLDRGGDAVQTLMSQLVFHVAPKLIELCLTVGLLYFGYGLVPPLILLGVIAAYLWATLTLTRRRIAIKAEMDAVKSSISAMVAESANNFEIIKSLRTEAARSTLLNGVLSKAGTDTIRWERNLVVINIVQALIIAAGVCGSLAYAAHRVVAGAYSVGDFVLVNSLILQITTQLSNAASMYRNVVDSLSDIKAAMSLLSIEGETRPTTSQGRLTKTNSVEFVNVSFSYSAERRTLSNVSLFVPSGSRLAIVGPTGSGKTSLIRMLTGIIHPDEGELRIGDEGMHQLSSDTLGDLISVVPQDVTLFNGTIEENIRTGVAGVSDEEMNAAVDSARLSALISRLPEGLQTQIGERGLKLSGGERQRVALARALIRKTPIVVLDEATSALDTKTEAEIKEALRRVHGVTLVVVAHRLTSIAEFDQIVVLDRGCIVEQGSHDELLARGGTYKAMWDRQVNTSYGTADVVAA